MMRKAVLIMFLFVSTLVQADDTMVTQQVSVSDVMSAPAMRDNQDLVISMAEKTVETSTVLKPELKKALSRSLRELPFHRIADIHLSFISGIPDLVGLCLEGHPTNPLAIEACASTIIFVSSLSLAVKYRWDLVLHETASGKIHQLALGPGVAVRKMQTICFDTCQDGWGADVMASLQYVFWFVRHFGLNAQLDAGATYFKLGSGPDSSRIIPMVKLTVGVSF